MDTSTLSSVILTFRFLAVADIISPIARDCPESLHLASAFCIVGEMLSAAPAGQCMHKKRGLTRKGARTARTRRLCNIMQIRGFPPVWRRKSAIRTN